MCPFLSYSTPEAATEATWRPYLAPVSSKASFLFKYGGRRGAHSEVRRAPTCWSTSVAGFARGAACRTGGRGWLGRATATTASCSPRARTWKMILRERSIGVKLQRLRVIWGHCCLRVAAGPCLPNGTITQLSPYFTRNPCTCASARLIVFGSLEVISNWSCHFQIM